MANKVKFTKELKEKWLENLRSGEFKQIQFGYSTCSEGKNLGMQGNCCLNVLDETVCKIYKVGFAPPWFTVLPVAPDVLINANDGGELPKNRDYSNVIPIIESLPTVD